MGVNLEYEAIDIAPDDLAEKFKKIREKYRGVFLNL